MMFCAQNMEEKYYFFRELGFSMLKGEFMPKRLTKMIKPV